MLTLCRNTSNAEKILCFHCTGTRSVVLARRNFKMTLRTRSEAQPNFIRNRISCSASGRHVWQALFARPLSLSVLGHPFPSIDTEKHVSDLIKLFRIASTPAVNTLEFVIRHLIRNRAERVYLPKKERTRAHFAASAVGRVSLDSALLSKTEYIFGAELATYRSRSGGASVGEPGRSVGGGEVLRIIFVRQERRERRRRSEIIET